MESELKPSDPERGGELARACKGISRRTLVRALYGLRAEGARALPRPRAGRAVEAYRGLM